MNYLVIDKLHKRYGKKQVLSDISMTIDKPNLVAVVGRNGVGKTTFFNLILGMTKQSSGTILVCDEQPIDNVLLSGKVAIVDNKMSYDRNKNLSKIIDLHAEYNPRFDKDKALRIINLFSLDSANKYYKMSTGMKAQFDIAIGLASNSEIILLDEPVAGLDDLSRRKFYNLMFDEYRQNSKLIMVSTHMFAELQGYVESVIILEGSKIIYNDTVDSLKGKMLKIVAPLNVIEHIANKRPVYRLSSNKDSAEIVVMNNLTDTEMTEIMNVANISEIDVDLIVSVMGDGFYA